MVAVRGRRSSPHLVADRADARRFASFARAAHYRSATPDRNFAMMRAAFDLSERYHTPVIVRPHHAHQPRLDVLRRRGRRRVGADGGFERDQGRSSSRAAPTGAQQNQRAFGSHRARFRGRAHFAGGVQPDGRGRRAVDRGCTNRCFTLRTFDDGNIPKTAASAV